MDSQAGITVEHDNTVPIHMQLLTQLRQLILSGQWPPGSRIPSETQLQRDLHISRSTVRQAYSRAEAEGLIKRVPGKGTYVNWLPHQEATGQHIGYIANVLSSDFEYRILIGAEHAAKSRGFHILFSNVNDPHEEPQLIDQLLKGHVAGLLIFPTLMEQPSRHLFELEQQRLVPFVCVDRTLPGLTSDFVTSDNFAGAVAAVEYLIGLGHRRIAFLSHPILQLSTVAERLRGYRQALQDARLTPLEPWLVGVAEKEIQYRATLRVNHEGEVTKEEILQVVDFLKRPQRPTALFAMNDAMALLALKAARLLHLGVPDDLSVVGFDDREIASHLDVPLTTVAQDGFALGRRAAELLIDRISGYDGPQRQVVVPTQLKVRATAGPPSPHAVDSSGLM